MTGTLTRVTGWMHQLAQNMARSTPRSHVATVQGHCAHCREETTWAVHVMSAYYRCRQCGDNPLDDGSPSDA